MFRNKKINLIVAIVLAVVLWVYVVGEVNPYSTQTVKNIPINLEGESILLDNELVILSKDISSVSITVSGQRADVGALSTQNFNVSCDVSDLKYGENRVRLRYTSPDNVQLEKVSNEYTTIYVDHFVQQKKDIKVVYDGEFQASVVPSISNMNRKTVTVSGAEMFVNNVEYMKATVTEEMINKGSGTYELDLLPCDKNGEEVKNVNYNVSTAKITLSLNYERKLDLSDIPITILGLSEEELLMTSAEPFNGTVTIIGEEGIVNSLTQDKIILSVDFAKYKEEQGIVDEVITSGEYELELLANVMLSDGIEGLIVSPTTTKILVDDGITDFDKE